MNTHRHQQPSAVRQIALQWARFAAMAVLLGLWAGTQAFAQQWFRVAVPHSGNQTMIVTIEAADAGAARTKAGDVMRSIMNHQGAAAIPAQNVTPTVDPYAASWQNQPNGDYWVDVYVYNLQRNELYQLIIRSFNGLLPAARNEAQNFAANRIFARDPVNQVLIATAALRNTPAPGFGQAPAAAAGAAPAGRPAGDAEPTVPAPTTQAGIWYQVQSWVYFSPQDVYTFTLEAVDIDDLTRKVQALMKNNFNQRAYADFEINTAQAQRIANPYGATFLQSPTNHAFWFDCYAINPATREGVQLVFRDAVARPTGNAHPDYRAYQYITQNLWRDDAQRDGIRFIPHVARSVPADTTTAATPAGSPPQNVAATPSPGGFNLSWQAVAGATRYRVRLKPVAENNWSYRTVNSTSTTISGLRSTARHEVEVAVTNADGTFGPAASIRVTPGPPIPTPQQPTLQPGEGSMSVTWRALSNAGGYRVAISTSRGMDADLQVVELPPGTLTYAFSELAGETEYFASIQGYNDYYETAAIVGLPARTLAVRPPASASLRAAPAPPTQTLPRASTPRPATIPNTGSTPRASTTPSITSARPAPAQATRTWNVTVRIAFTTRTETREYLVEADSEEAAFTAGEAAAREDIGRVSIRSLTVVSAVVKE